MLPQDQDTTSNPFQPTAPPFSQATTLTTHAMVTKPLTIIVASKNPVKIRAALQAFTRMFPPPPTSNTSSNSDSEWHTARGISVPSGVSDQPMSDAETLLGARNRAERVRALEPEADYWVGIEGGVDFDPDEPSGEVMRNFAWIVVLGPCPPPTISDSGKRDGNGVMVDGEGRKGEVRMGKARTATYYLPRETARLVKGGMELGHADEVVFGGRNSKQKNGSVGLLTGDVIDRRGYYEEAVVLALIPFRNGGLTF